jgi:hypothetical protein
MAPINGGIEGEIDAAFFSLPVERRGDRGGGARPAAAAPCTTGVGAGGGRRSARWAGPEGLVGWLAAWAGRGWLGPAERPRPGGGGSRPAGPRKVAGPQGRPGRK